MDFFLSQFFFVFKKLLLIVLPLRDFLPPVIPSSKFRMIITVSISILGLVLLVCLAVSEIVWAAIVPLEEILFHLNDLVNNWLISLVMMVSLIYLILNTVMWNNKDSAEATGCQMLLSKIVLVLPSLLSCYFSCWIFNVC